jgi:hypothetical protein
VISVGAKPAIFLSIKPIEFDSWHLKHGKATSATRGGPLDFLIMGGRIVYWVLMSIIHLSSSRPTCFCHLHPIGLDLVGPHQQHQIGNILMTPSGGAAHHPSLTGANSSTVHLNQMQLATLPSHFNNGKFETHPFFIPSSSVPRTNLAKSTCWLMETCFCVNSGCQSFA